MNPKIGVYICHCGTNISQTVDINAVAQFSAALPGVAVARDYKYMCSEPGQAMIKQDIKDLQLERVVVSSCSPLMHELTFRHTVADAGLNQFLFQMANIREQCSWVHEDRARATQKAQRLIAAAVRRVRHHEPLQVKEVPVNSNALVVGAGIAGIEAALQIAEAGRKVYLVEKEPSIGGHMAQFDKTFPTLDCAACVLTPKMVAVAQNKNIELLCYSEVAEVSGYVGNFKVKVRRKPRYVHEQKCTGCAECEKVCPAEFPSEFEVGLKNRRAIYRSFPQAVPNAFIIDKLPAPAPCRLACPAGCNNQGYARLISQGKFKEALALIRETVPLPSVCGRVCNAPCEENCNRSQVDEPLQMRGLKRFVADLEMKGIIEPPPVVLKEAKKKESVAIVGSGPAGLTCAYDLARLGYAPTVFEALPQAGGMLRVGIPKFRLPADALDYDIEMIKRAGVKILTQTPVGPANLMLKDLLQKGFQAVFVAIGLHRSKELGIEGEDLAGVLRGVEFLREASMGRLPDFKGKTVAVVGGGNTALDAARTALRLGARKTLIIYRRSREEMPAAERELKEAAEEGIQILYLLAPHRILGDKGKVVGIECRAMKLTEELDPTGRKKVVPDEAKEKLILRADIVIPAVAQAPDFSALQEVADGSLATQRGFLQVDELTLATNVPGIFAGGDVIGREGLVVQAMAQGHEAAISIDRYLQGLDLRPGREKEKEKPAKLTGREIQPQHRQEIPQLAVAERIGNFTEVEAGLTPAQAQQEASRCLSCSGCCECLECAKVCEPGAIDHQMPEQIRELEVGAIVLATGFELFDGQRAAQFGYRRLPNVVSSLEFERMSSASGPSQGRILLKNQQAPEAVAILHCIGSRDENYNEYCSRVCCMYALKFSHLVREKAPQARVYDLYIDMRAFGKGYEEFYKRCLKEDVIFIRGKGAEVTEFAENPAEKGKLIVQCEDTLLGRVRRLPVDMVILCNALEPGKDTRKLAGVFGINVSKDGFFMEKHPKLAPAQTLVDGIFLAGVCQGPKDIPDSVAQAGLAGVSALALIDKGKVQIEPITVSCAESVCGGCKICLSVCPYDALKFNEAKRIVEVEEALCKGCGTCNGVCPSGAARQRMFMDEEIFSEIEGILA